MAASKGVDEEPGRASAMAVFRHMLLNVGANTAVVGTRPVLLLYLLKGDAARATSMQALWAGGIGVMEFLVNPALGPSCPKPAPRSVQRALSPTPLNPIRASHYLC